MKVNKIRKNKHYVLGIVLKNQKLISCPILKLWVSKEVVTTLFYPLLILMYDECWIHKPSLIFLGKLYTVFVVFRKIGLIGQVTIGKDGLTNNRYRDWWMIWCNPFHESTKQINSPHFSLMELLNSVLNKLVHDSRKKIIISLSE